MLCLLVRSTPWWCREIRVSQQGNPTARRKEGEAAHRHWGGSVMNKKQEGGRDVALYPQWHLTVLDIHLVTEPCSCRNFSPTPLGLPVSFTQAMWAHKARDLRRKQEGLWGRNDPGCVWAYGATSILTKSCGHLLPHGQEQELGFQVGTAAWAPLYSQWLHGRGTQPRIPWAGLH